jgi:hypothetical protein
MLVGFFKLDEEAACDCRVVHYWDRIWIGDDETARFIRSFTVAVLPTSTHSLREVQMLLPTKDLVDLKSIAPTAFDESWYFNSRAWRTSGSYEVIQRPVESPHYGLGRITDETIENINVFVGELAEPRHYLIKDCRLVQFRFPTAIEAGQNVQCRISFSVPGVARNLTPTAQLKNYAVDLRYFSASRYHDECAILGTANVIRILPTLGGDLHAGGFSVLLYSPPNFVKASGFEKAEEKLDYRNPDGREGLPRVKLVWQLRKLLAEENAPPDSLIGLEREFSFQGTFIQRETGELFERVGRIPERIEELEKKVKEQTREIRFATWVAIIAVIFALLGLVPLFTRLMSLLRTWLAGSR